MAGEAHESGEFRPIPSDAPRRSSGRIWVIGIVLVGLLAGGGYFALNRPGRAQPAASTGPRAVPVVTVPARTGDLPVYLTGLGSVTAAEHRHRPQPRRRPAHAVAFQEGQLVKAGDLLAEIDPRPVPGPAHAGARASSPSDEAALSNARLDLERYQTLVTRATPSRSSSSTPRPPPCRQFEASSKTDQGKIDNAKLQLTYCRITAPITGRVGLRLVDPGNIVHANDAQRPRRDHPAPADRGRVHDPRGQPPAGARAASARRAPSRWRPSIASGSNRLGSRHAARRRQPDRPDAPAPSSSRPPSPNADGTLFPNQFVNARLLVDTLQAARSLVPNGGDPARRPGRVRLRGEARPDGRRCARSQLGADRGRVTAVRERRRRGRRARRGRRRQVQERSRVEPTTPASGRSPARRSARPAARTMNPSRAVHPAAGRDHAAHGRDPPRRRSSPTGCSPVSALPQVDYPTIQVPTFYPGASPDVMASVGHRAARAPVRPDARAQADDVDQLERQLGHHAAVRPRPRARRRRAGGAGRDQRGAPRSCPRDLPNPPVYSKVNPADAPILTLGLTSADPAAARGRGPRRHAARARRSPSFPGVGPRQHQRRPAAGGPRAGQSRRALAAYGLTLEDLRIAVAAANVNQAKGSFDGPRQAFTIGANDQLAHERALPAARSSPTATARRCTSPTSPTSSTTRRTCTRRPG